MDRRKGFQLKKYKVQLILSRKYQLKEKYNFEAIMQHGTAPWDSVSVNKSATIEKLMREKNICIEQAMKIWDDCAAQNPISTSMTSYVPLIVGCRYGENV